MPDWECGNVPFDIIPSAGPVRAGRAIQQKQEKGVFRSDQLDNEKREAKALLYSVIHCNSHIESRDGACFRESKLKMLSRRRNLDYVSI